MFVCAIHIGVKIFFAAVFSSVQCAVVLVVLVNLYQRDRAHINMTEALFTFCNITALFIAYLILMVPFLFFCNFLVDLREERNIISGYFKGEEKDSVVSFPKFLLQ